MSEDLEKIAFGGDSRVYKNQKGQVLKVYDGGPFGRPLSENKVRLYAEITNEVAKHTWNIANYQVIINPVENVFYDEKRRSFVATGKLVDGPRVIDLTNWSNFLPSLQTLSKEINKRFGIKGVNLTPGNVKVVGDTLIVTDLCASINGISKV